MKKILLALLIIFAFCSISTATIKDSPDGFRGIKWGDPPSALGARIKTGDGQFSITYEKKGDKLSIGSAKLKSIRYKFLQDH